MLPSHRPSLRASASRNQFRPAIDRCGQNDFPSLFSQHPPKDGAIAGGPGLGSLLFPTTGPLLHRGGRTSSLGTLTGILLFPERNALYSLSPSVVCGQVGTLPCIFGVGVYGDSQGRNLPPTVGPSRSPRQDPRSPAARGTLTIPKTSCRFLAVNFETQLDSGREVVHLGAVRAPTVLIVSITSLT